MHGTARCNFFIWNTFSRPCKWYSLYLLWTPLIYRVVGVFVKSEKGEWGWEKYKKGEWPYRVGGCSNLLHTILVGMLLCIYSTDAIVDFPTLSPFYWPPFQLIIFRKFPKPSTISEQGFIPAWSLRQSPMAFRGQSPKNICLLMSLRRSNGL